MLRRSREMDSMDFLTSFEKSTLREERSVTNSVVFIAVRYLAHIRTKKELSAFERAVLPGLSEAETRAARVEVLQDPQWRQWRDLCDRDEEQNSEAVSRTYSEMLEELDEILKTMGVSTNPNAADSSLMMSTSEAQMDNQDDLFVDEEDEDELLTFAMFSALLNARRETKFGRSGSVDNRRHRFSSNGELGTTGLVIPQTAAPPQVKKKVKGAARKLSAVNEIRATTGRPAILSGTKIDDMEFAADRWKRSKDRTDFKALLESKVAVPPKPAKPVRPPVKPVRPPTVAFIAGTQQRAGRRRVPGAAVDETAAHPPTPPPLV